MSWDGVLELARSGDAGREHRAIVQAWTLLRYEDFPHLSTWPPVKVEALALIDKLHQKYGDDAESFARDLSRLEDAILHNGKGTVREYVPIKPRPL